MNGSLPAELKFRENTAILDPNAWSKLLENHTLHSGTYIYSPYIGSTPPGLFCLRGVACSGLRLKAIEKFGIDWYISLPTDEN